MNPAARLGLRHIRHDDRGSVAFMAGGENHDILQDACGTIGETHRRDVQRVEETRPLAHLARMLG